MRSVICKHGLLHRECSEYIDMTQQLQLPCWRTLLKLGEAHRSQCVCPSTLLLVQHEHERVSGSSLAS